MEYWASEIEWMFCHEGVWQYPVVWWQIIPHGFLCRINYSWRAAESFLIPGALRDRSPVCSMTGWMTMTIPMSCHTDPTMSCPFDPRMSDLCHIDPIPEHPISCLTRQVLRSAALSDRSKLSSQSLSKLKTISLHQFIFQLLHNNLTFDILVCPETYVWWHLS